ncbi:hypothetical protein ACPXCS_29220 [Streptomyces sp. DT190]|jgi:hypothetical protein|uniref:hypothetical protein n=1 Tax=unclassified Streptomyces TaxID=2593676 RepID=UPI003CF84CDF
MRTGRPAVAAGPPGALRLPAHAEGRDTGRDTLYGPVDGAAAADRAVARGAGAGRIP